MTLSDDLKCLSDILKSRGFKTRKSGQDIMAVRTFDSADWGQGFKVRCGPESSFYFEVVSGITCKRITDRLDLAQKHALGRNSGSGIPAGYHSVVLGPRTRFPTDGELIQKTLDSIEALHAQILEHYDVTSIEKVMAKQQENFDKEPMFQATYLIVFNVLMGDMVAAKINADRYFKHHTTPSGIVVPEPLEREFGYLGIEGYDRDRPLCAELQDLY